MILDFPTPKMSARDRHRNLFRAQIAYYLLRGGHTLYLDALDSASHEFINCLYDDSKIEEVASPFEIDKAIGDLTSRIWRDFIPSK